MRGACHIPPRLATALLFIMRSIWGDMLGGHANILFLLKFYALILEFTEGPGLQRHYSDVLTVILSSFSFLLHPLAGIPL